MMYIHYCPQCRHIHILNGHKQSCPRCEEQLAELKIDYLTYTSYSDQKRADFLAECAVPERLAKLKTTYRMYKYSKWYRDKVSASKNKEGDSCNNE